MRNAEFGVWAVALMPLTRIPHSHFLRLKIFTKRPTGSKNSSITRSFSGMIALSVMVMFSGHTAVQHFVMLQ